MTNSQKIKEKVKQRHGNAPQTGDSCCDDTCCGGGGSPSSSFESEGTGIRGVLLRKVVKSVNIVSYT